MSEPPGRRRWVPFLGLVVLAVALGLIVAALSPWVLGGRRAPSVLKGGPSEPVVDSPPPASARPLPSGSVRRVWLIVMENKEDAAVLGSPRAPYLNGLAAKYGLATNFYATGHHSLLNYVALVAGSTLGVTTDTPQKLTAPTIFSQLTAAGQSWRVYAQDDPNGCYTGIQVDGGVDGPGSPGPYVRRHNPAINFSAIANDPTQCANIQPLGRFNPAAAPFELIVPNLVNDMHNGTIAQGDAFLAVFVPSITSSPAFVPGSVLFITFDEGSTNAGSFGDDGGQIATLIIAPGMPAGYRTGAYADHLSLLRTAEDVLGLPCLAGACAREPLGF
jgi:acid phosphatase